MFTLFRGNPYMGRYALMGFNFLEANVPAENYLTDCFYANVRFRSFIIFPINYRIRCAKSKQN